MKSKNKHPLLNRKLKSKPNNARKRGLVIAGLLLLFLVSYFIWSPVATVDSDSTSIIAVAPQVTTTQTVTADATTDVEVDANIEIEAKIDTDVIDNTDLNATTVNHIPSPKAILNAPIPETDSLAKEEIDRLDDQQQRLAQQQQQAAKQVQMSKHLTELKAEQIELLEQQIAELESRATNQ